MDRILLAFPAFKHRNYKLFFSGQLISLIGTWLQMVAQGWLVFQLTHSAFSVGLVAALGNLPILIFILFGGVTVDRFNKRKILLFTQTSSMILALTLGLLTIFNLINLTEILILSFLLGTVTALDSPARQSFVIHLVGRKDLISAIALNSGVFNGARVIGPAVAGFIIAASGVGGAFILNSLSYIAVIIALIFINVKENIPSNHLHPLKALQEGISYSLSHNILKTLLIFTGITSIFGWSYSIIMPVIVQDVFHKGAAELGYLFSATGVGAILATFVISALSKKIKPLYFIITGNFIFAISTLIFTFTSNFIFALVFLFFSGFGLIMQLSTINSMIQHLVPNHIRGRIMSIYALMFKGLIPIGSFQIGFLAEHLGAFQAIRLGIILIFLFGLYLYYNRKNIQAQYSQHLNNNNAYEALQFQNA